MQHESSTWSGITPKPPIPELPPTPPIDPTGGSSLPPPPPPPPPPPSRPPVADREPPGETQGADRPRVSRGAIALAVLAGLLGAGGGAIAGALVADDGGQGTAAVVSTTPVAREGVDASNVVKPVLDEVQPSVVAIETQGRAAAGPFGRSIRTQAAGTGMIVSSDGLIVTNAHVVAGADRVTVTLADGSSYDARVVGADSSIDVAVLQIDEDVSGLPAVTFAAEPAEVGETVVAIGNALALGAEPTVTLGIVSAVDRSIEVGNGITMEDLVQTDAAINSGNSGGP
ncbi:MAG TPA: trypsin-like peptidase domain-containing protein, partial [Acidimicrobiales bacterium]